MGITNSKNYRMYVMCINCFRWKSFSIPRGVEAKQIVGKRRCEFCGCSYGPNIIPINKQQMEDTKKEMRKMVSDIWSGNN